jgi:hypothetical protein
MPAPLVQVDWSKNDGYITLQNKHGFYKIDPYQFDKALRAFTGMTVGRLKELLSEHTDCDYSDIHTMSELLIIAAETGLV